MKLFPCLCLTLGMFLMMPHSAGAQVQRCHTMDYLEELKKNDPQLEQKIEQARNLARQYLYTEQTRKRGQRELIVIPVVVHVMHNGQQVGTGKNISDAQIQSQFQVLNEDYQAVNGDIANVPQHFTSVTGNPDLQFCLASIDPQGNATSGIDRVNIGSARWNDSLKPLTIWDPSRYLNIWVTELSGGELGFTTFPGMSPEYDGVVIDYRYFGKAPWNPYSSKFNLGRTATHEIGHWLGLEHTFRRGCKGTSSSDCDSDGDFICDTPPTEKANYGCNLPFIQNSCTETPVDQPDMWMNYMDYMDDACLYMFSQGQVDEMRSVLNTTRAGILNSFACGTNNLFTLSGKVVDAQSGQGVTNARILLQASGSYELESDADGNFSSSYFRPGSYAIYAGRWGYVTKEFSSSDFIDSSSGSIIISLQKGYYDDFFLDYGWTTSSTASAGLWERSIPEGTDYNGKASNPGEDIPDDFGNKCYVTGNGGGSVGYDDVDNGEVVLMSPVFDLLDYNEPYINYYRWFFNGGGQGSPNDQLIISLSNGEQTQVIETLDANTPSSNQWNFKSVRVKDFITPSANMQFTAKTSDQSSSGHLVEAALDEFSVVDSMPVSVPVLQNDLAISIYPNPASDLMNITIRTTQPYVNLTIIDVSGKAVLEDLILSNKATSQIDITGYPRGIYWAKLVTEKSSVVRKFTIIR